MTLENLHNFFIILGWSTAFLAAIGGAGSWITGNIIDNAKDQKIIALKEKVQNLEPRILSDAQKKRLIEKLKTYEGSKRIAFYSRMMDRESAGFADQLAQTFKDAGWDVGATNRSSLNDFPGFLSLFVVGNPPKTLPSFVQLAFREIEIDCHSENIKENSLSGLRDQDRVYVVVGSKI